MVVGVGASRVRDLFTQAKAAAPSIIFIDELDAIGRQRGGGASLGGHDEREQTLNQILTEMDGFTGSEGVIVLASTNRPDVLDAALLRPGRFDRRVTVNPPDVEGREKILEVHTRSVPLADDVDLKGLAATTPGMVGADLRNLVNEAALGAAKARPQGGRVGRLLQRLREDRPRHRAAHHAQPRGARAHRLPRGRPRAAGHAGAGRRPGPQGLDRPARPRARRHLPVARERPLRLRHRLPAGPDRRRAGRPRGRGDRVRVGHHRRRVRPPAGHPDRALDGRPLGHVGGDRPGHRHLRRAAVPGDRSGLARRRAS